MIRRFLNATLCLSLCLALGACSASEDKHSFKSTTYSPKTVRVIDGTNNNVLYNWEGEPGTELILNLDGEGGGGIFVQDRGPATSMSYKVRDSVSRKVVDSGEVELTGEPEIQLIARPIAHRQSTTSTTVTTDDDTEMSDEPAAPADDDAMEDSDDADDDAGDAVDTDGGPEPMRDDVDMPVGPEVDESSDTESEDEFK